RMVRGSSSADAPPAGSALARVADFISIEFISPCLGWRRRSGAGADKDRPTITSEMQEARLVGFGADLPHVMPAVQRPSSRLSSPARLVIRTKSCDDFWTIHRKPRMLDRTPSAVDLVITAVKDRIRDARYAPGQRLIEPELMREFGVGRGTVREG